jgi:hypothetical protein
MTNNKQQTAVDSLKDFFKQYDLAHSSLDYYEFKIPMHIFDLKFQETKEMEKERTINFTEDWYFNGPLLGEGIDVKNTIEQHFNNTYGGGEQ